MYSEAKLGELAASHAQREEGISCEPALPRTISFENFGSLPQPPLVLHCHY